MHQSGETNSNTQATVIRPLSEVTNIQKQARQALRVARLKQSYDSQYGPLFLRLKISDVNRQKFLDLLIERGEKGNKILPALQEKYKVTSVEFQSALAALNDEVVAKAASFLSSEECSMFSDYTNTLGSRMFVNGMNALYLADTPDVLTGEQTEKLINILKTKSTLDRDNYPTVSNEALILAAEFLNKEQLDAMKLQREQLETRRLTAQEVQQKH